MFVLTVFIFNILLVLSDDISSRLINLREERQNHNDMPLNNKQIGQVADMSDMNHFKSVLDKILIPRVVGTPNHEKVKKFLIQTMEDLGWDVETDRFQDNTPVFGRLTFENIVATFNPAAKRFLALACHYDSKYFRKSGFVGATDSAVPCAMMINLAHTLNSVLKKTSNDDVSLMFIFFDGEEAFQTWSSKDSIYGAKHLAKKWQNTNYKFRSIDASNYLDSLDMIVLLDLLGTPDPKFYSFFPQTEQWYSSLIHCEEKLASLGKFSRYSVGRPSQKYFQTSSLPSGIEDDHLPFLRRGVKILHVIPYPFPDVWHKFSDNKNAISFSTVENLNKILRVFVVKYLHLQV